jgi:hypothetical protein
MILRVSLDASDVTKTMRTLYTDQIPYATSLALNDVSKQAQEAQRGHDDRVFTVRRRAWMDNQVKIKPFASKRSLFTVVKIDPPGGRSDILSKFQDGGTKTPTHGRKALAIPAKRGATVSRANRPRSLNFRMHGTGPKATVYRGDRRTVLIQRPDGSGGIFQRTGRDAGGERTRDILGKYSGYVVGSRRKRRGNFKLLYSFARTGRIDTRLRFEENITRKVEQAWPTAFGRAFEQAVRTAR